MKVLAVIVPFLVAAKVDYYAQAGEFCGTADNGEIHNCHGALECVNEKCAPGGSGNNPTPVGLPDPELYPAEGGSGNNPTPVGLPDPELYPAEGGSNRVGLPDPELYPAGGSYYGPHVVHHVVHHVYHDAPYHGYYGGHHGYHGYHGYHTGYTTYHHPYYTHSYGSHYYGGNYSPHRPVYYTGLKKPHHAPVNFNSPSSWTSVKLTDYTQEDQPCGPTGLGVNQKPCAPWLACYKQVVRSGFLAVQASMNYACKPKMVRLGQRCGRAKTGIKYSYINVGRCPSWSHCQEDRVPLVGGSQLGAGFCTQTPLERFEDAVDPFHSSI